MADASWEALGAAGPPYFKKMRRRGGLAEPLVCVCVLGRVRVSLHGGEGGYC